MSLQSASSVPIQQIAVSAFSIPGHEIKSCGRSHTDKTDIVLVEASAGRHRGLGYTFSDLATAKLIHVLLRPVVEQGNAMCPTAIWNRMMQQARTLEQPARCSLAISAVDIALWDLKAKLLQQPLVQVLGQVREASTLCASSDFDTEEEPELEKQLGEWVQQGMRQVKIKVGRADLAQPHRVREARRIIGDNVELCVDADGVYSRREALTQMERFADYNVTWFEEPTTSHDLEGLRQIRDHAPAGMNIVAGKYGYSPSFFHRITKAEAVDVLQADATRCGGITGLLIAATLCQAQHLTLSSVGPPGVHLHPGCAIGELRNLEYSPEHAMLESMLFDGVPGPSNGELRPELSHPGHGFQLKRRDAEKYAA